jgi:hypothetical protein
MVGEMFEADCSEWFQRNLTNGQLLVFQNGKTTVYLRLLCLKQHGSAHSSCGHNKFAAAGVDTLLLLDTNRLSTTFGNRS